MHNPLKQAPNEMAPKVYNSDRITEATQFGIAPIIVANKGVKYLFEFRNSLN